MECFQEVFNGLGCTLSRGAEAINPMCWDVHFLSAADALIPVYDERVR